MDDVGPDTVSLPPKEMEVPFSILDTDLYKFTMQYAVFKQFPDAQVVIRFTNRSPEMLFSRKTFDWTQEHVNRLSTLRLTASERGPFSKACPYFPSDYLDYLSNISLDPKNQVDMTFHPVEGDLGAIEIVIEGPWKDCILYEVPIMSILSEAYFRFDDTDWNLDGQQEKARRKALELFSRPNGANPCLLSEFGTRRRRSFQTQDLVIRGLIQARDEYISKAGKAAAPSLAGTSNVYLATKYGLAPSGTIAHEWIMAIGAIYGYKGANGRAMDMWEEVYPDKSNRPPLTMLTDTFTAAAFFEDFTSQPERAQRWGGLRQDSGDPFAFIEAAKEGWRKVEERLGVIRDDGHVAKGKRIIFSDGIDVKRALELQEMCDGLHMGASFGIGTSLTNDFQKVSNPKEVSNPLNIVIKLNQIDGKECVKLSDDKGKYTGSLDEVRRVQHELNLPTEHEEQRRG